MSKQKILEVLKTGINAGPPPSFPQIDLAYASQCAGKRVGEAFACALRRIEMCIRDRF